MNSIIVVPGASSGLNKKIDWSKNKFI
jgi:hypothetical protein